MNDETHVPIVIRFPWAVQDCKLAANGKSQARPAQGREDETPGRARGTLMGCEVLKRPIRIHQFDELDTQRYY